MLMRAFPALLLLLLLALLSSRVRSAKPKAPGAGAGQQDIRSCFAAVVVAVPDIGAHHGYDDPLPSPAQHLSHSQPVTVRILLQPKHM